MAGLVVLLTVSTAGIWLALDREQIRTDLPGTTAPTEGRAAREARLVALLAELAPALREGRDPTLFASPTGSALLANVGHNVRAIGLGELGFSYVAPAEPAAQQLSTPGTWLASVRVAWRFERYDIAPSSLEVPMVVHDDGQRARFAGFTTARQRDRIPAWLLERLVVRKSPRTLVLASRHDRAGMLAGLARVAVSAVGEVLPAWQGPLVLAEPSTSARLNAAVGSEASSTAQLAGITTTADGGIGRGLANHVLLNPAVFGRLGPKAAQIVVTHEATHVATDGAVSSSPEWLVEGFADYVALHDSELPVSVSAGQILARVRAEGSPDALPAALDFGAESTSLGTAYESAWLACRLIAERYGERRLVAFYRRADRAGSVAGAFREVLGVTEPAFTRSWARHLDDLASRA